MEEIRDIFRRKTDQGAQFGFDLVAIAEAANASPGGQRRPGKNGALLAQPQRQRRMSVIIPVSFGFAFETRSASVLRANSCSARPSIGRKPG